MRIHYRTIFSYLCIFFGVLSDTNPVAAQRDLPEFVVKAEQFKRTPEGLEVVPNKRQLKHSSSGYGLIRNLMIPGVQVNVDKGEINALGGAVSLFIDGLPSDVREVRQLRPADVLKVQYMESPTGKYAGNNVVLNFILKKRDTGGYIAIDALQRVGYTNGDYNLAAKVYGGNTQYTLFGGSDFSDIKGAQTIREEDICFPSSAVGRHYSSYDSRKRKNSQYAQFRVRNKNERRTLRATFNFVRDASPEDSESSKLDYSGLDSGPLSVESSKNSSSRGFKYSLGLSGSFNLSHGQFMESSASATASRNHYAYEYNEAKEDVLSSTVENYYSFTADLTYGLKFKRGNSLVFKLSELYNVSSADYYGNNASWQHLWSSETLLFGEYVHPLWGNSSVRVAPGVSAQFYRLHGRERVKHIAPRLQFVFTTRPVDKQFLQLLALYGNSFPQLSFMSAATQRVDLIQLKRGNPDLKQTGIMRFMAVYGLGVGNLNMQAVALYNGAYKLQLTNYSFENGMLVQSYLPDGRWNQLDFSLSATWMPSSKLNLQATGGWMYNRYSKAADISSACWKGSAQAAYYLGDFSINAHVETPVKATGYNLETVRTPWLYGLSVSWGWKSLRVEAGTNNPFSRRPLYRYSLDTQEYRFHNAYYTPADRTSAYIKLNWSLDFGKKASRDSRNIDRSISTGILRAD